MSIESWLMEANLYDPVAEEDVMVYLAKNTVFFNANDAAAPNRTYRGYLTQAMSGTRGMEGLSEALGSIGGSTGIGAAVVTLDDDAAALRAAWKDLIWVGRPFQIYQGLLGAARNTYVLRYDGLFAAQPQFEKMRGVLAIADLLEKLDQPFQPATFGGTGGHDGGADLKGAYKQDAVGDVFFADVQWTDQDNGWCHVCASGFHTVYRVTDGASELDEDVSNPPASTKYYVDAANGRLRFGSPPIFGYRVDFRSNFASGSRALGTICSTIASSRAGFSGGQIDSTAFTALNTDRPEKVGWLVQGGMTMRELFNALLGGMLCFYATTPDKLTVGRLQPTTATAKTDAQVARVFTDADIMPDTLVPQAIAAPPHTINVQAKRNFGVLSDNQLAALAPQADKDFAREEWRVTPFTNATTQANYPTSKAKDLATPMTDLSEVAGFGADARDLLTVPRVPANITLAIAPFGLQAGAEIWIESAVNEIDGPARVVTIDEDENDLEVRLGLFGLEG